MISMETASCYRAAIVPFNIFMLKITGYALCGAKLMSIDRYTSFI